MAKAGQLVLVAFGITIVVNFIVIKESGAIVDSISERRRPDPDLDTAPFFPDIEATHQEAGGANLNKMYQSLNELTNEVILQNLRSAEADNFLIAPRVLHLSLAKLTKIIKDGSETKSTLMDFLGCDRGPIECGNNNNNNILNCDAMINAHENITADNDFYEIFLDKDNMISSELESKNISFMSTNQYDEWAKEWTNSILNVSNDKDNGMIMASGSVIKIGLNDSNNSNNSNMVSKAINEHVVHNFVCDGTEVSFGSFLAEAKLKVLPDEQLQMIEVDLGDKILQVIVPMVNHPDWEREFAALGFDAFEALVDVEKIKINMVFPKIAIQEQVDLRPLMSQFGLDDLFVKAEDFVTSSPLTRLPQILDLSLILDNNTMSAAETAESVIVNRPFVFRLIDFKTHVPIMAGNIVCPRSSNSSKTCIEMNSVCQQHGFCSTLGEICQAWKTCSGL